MSDDPASEEQEDIPSDEEDALIEDSAPLAEPDEDIVEPDVEPAVVEDVNLPDEAGPDAFS